MDSSKQESLVLILRIGAGVNGVLHSDGYFLHNRRETLVVWGSSDLPWDEPHRFVHGTRDPRRLFPPQMGKCQRPRNDAILFVLGSYLLDLRCVEDVQEKDFHQFVKSRCSSDDTQLHKLSGMGSRAVLPCPCAAT